MWSFISQLFQPESPCFLCQNLTGDVIGLCKACQQDLPLTGRACLSCGMPVCGTACACNPADWPFSAVLSACHYQFPADHLIHQFKETPRPELARPLARLMLQRIRRHGGPRPGLLAPVPAAANRLRERGFDQSLELARHLGTLLRIPVRHDVFQRSEGLPAQKGLNAMQREANIRQAFKAFNLSALPKHVALVDDVLTTGATARHLAGLLHGAGVTQVEIWTVARTL